MTASAATFNDRKGHPDAPPKRRAHVLEEFPDPGFEAVIVQWEGFRPTVLVQLLRDPTEPVQFPGKRPAVPGNSELPTGRPSVLDLPLLDFMDAASGRPYGREAYNADILFSQRAFARLQPEPDLVLAPEGLWECRAEALGAIGVKDVEGF